jgi:hypothetical protein
LAVVGFHLTQSRSHEEWSMDNSLPTSFSWLAFMW